MSVVLHHVALERSATVLRRPRSAAAAPREDAGVLAARAGYEEGLRQGRDEGHRIGLEQGLQQGRAQGLEQGRAQAVATAERLSEEARQAQARRDAALREAVAAFEQAVRDFAGAAEEDMVVLCQETIARVLGEAATDPQAIRGQVQALLAQWRGAAPLALHLHPASLALLEASGTTLTVPCVADVQVPAGGCLVRGSAGALEMRLDRVLQEVRASLLASCGGRVA